jgi:hypothetical protein
MKTMILTFALTLIPLALLAIVAFRLIHRIRSEKPAEALTLDWLEAGMTAHAVLPLLDNLAPFRHRIEQRRAFRLYLVAARRDYMRITYLVKRLLVSSDRDRPDLAKALFYQMVVFHVALILIEFRLALHVVGIRVEKAVELVELICDLVSDAREMAATLTLKTICQEGFI